MKLDIDFKANYKVNVLYVDYSYDSDSEYYGEVLVKNLDIEDAYMKLEDKYALELDLEPDQFEVQIYINEELLMEKEENLAEWVEWNASQGLKVI